MPAFDLQYRELLPYGVEMELDQLISALNATFDVDHDDSTGQHSDINCDSITTRSTVNMLPITGNLQLLKGGLYLDELGSSVNIAGIKPDQWTGHQDNYNPPGLANALVVEVSTDADRNITGIMRGSRRKRLMLWINRGNFNVTFKHNSSSSTDVNRVTGPNATDCVVGTGEGVWIWYDVGSEIFRIVGIV